MSENNKTNEAAASDSIKETGSSLVESSKGNIQFLTIIGQVEGHYLLGDTAKTTKYEHLIPLICNIEVSRDVDGLLLLLNTVGGDVEAGLAIAELIAGMKKPTASIVLGGGHSIGVPLAVSAKKSFIVPSATMTIHPVRTSGLVVGVEQSFEAMRRMQERISDFIVRNSNIKEDKLHKLIMNTDEIATDVGSVIDGYEAVKIGLIDEVGGLSRALDALHEMIDKKQ